jgi:hypothetical protein
VTTLVAHEPPLIPVLPDAAAAERARAGIRDAYEAKGRGAEIVVIAVGRGVPEHVHRTHIRGEPVAALGRLLAELPTGWRYDASATGPSRRSAVEAWCSLSR